MLAARSRRRLITSIEACSTPLAAWRGRFSTWWPCSPPQTKAHLIPAAESVPAWPIKKKERALRCPPSTEDDGGPCARLHVSKSNLEVRARMVWSCRLL